MSLFFNSTFRPKITIQNFFFNLVLKTKKNLNKQTKELCQPY